MPTLQVRDLPPEIYHRLAEAARREHRSLAQQAVVLLARALGVDPAPRERRRALVEAIAATAPRVRFPSGATPEELIRQDRER